MRGKERKQRKGNKQKRINVKKNGWEKRMKTNRRKNEKKKGKV